MPVMFSIWPCDAYISRNSGILYIEAGQSGAKKINNSGLLGGFGDEPPQDVSIMPRYMHKAQRKLHLRVIIMKRWIMALMFRKNTQQGD
jgi:hypothetical protein